MAPKHYDDEEGYRYYDGREKKHKTEPSFHDHPRACCGHGVHLARYHDGEAIKPYRKTCNRSGEYHLAFGYIPSDPRNPRFNTEKCDRCDHFVCPVHSRRILRNKPAPPEENAEDVDFVPITRIHYHITVCQHCWGRERLLPLADDAPDPSPKATAIPIIGAATPTPPSSTPSAPIGAITPSEFVIGRDGDAAYFASRGGPKSPSPNVPAGSKQGEGKQDKRSEGSKGGRGNASGYAVSKPRSGGGPAIAKNQGATTNYGMYTRAKGKSGDGNNPDVHGNKGGKGDANTYDKTGDGKNRKKGGGAGPGTEYFVVDNFTGKSKGKYLVLDESSSGGPGVFSSPSDDNNPLVPTRSSLSSANASDSSDGKAKSSGKAHAKPSDSSKGSSSHGKSKDKPYGKGFYGNHSTTSKGGDKSGKPMVEPSDNAESGEATRTESSDQSSSSGYVTFVSHKPAMQ